MSREQAIERVSSRSGFHLIACVDVGLPHWRMRVRCELLGRRSLSPIDEAILRSVQIGVLKRGELLVLLGLDEVVLDAAVVGLIEADVLVEVADNELELTERGKTVVDNAKLERSEDRIVQFEFDGLLRQSVLLSTPLQPSQLAELGMKEVPPAPASKPDLSELQKGSDEIQALIRSFRLRGLNQVDLLAIKETIRTERVYREATALVFRADEGRDLQVAFLVDGTSSPLHEQAFANGRLVGRLQLASGIRSRRRHSSLLPEYARNAFDADAETLARRAVTEARNLSTTARDEAPDEKLSQALRRLKKLPVRTVECYEHPGLMSVFIRSAKRRLVVVSPTITDSVVDNDFVHELRRALDRGVEIQLGYGVGKDPMHGVGEQALKRLGTVARDFAGFTVHHLGKTDSSAAHRDGSVSLLTGFPLLGHRGNASRLIADERGWLLSNDRFSALAQAADGARLDASPRVIPRKKSEAETRATQLKRLPRN